MTNTNSQMPFENRVFGSAIIKAINANYNADFSHQPRTLPDGTVYATDKVLKYSIRNFIHCCYPEEKIFYFKSYNEDLQPRDLDETYIKQFEYFPKKEIIVKSKKGKDKTKKVFDLCCILSNLLRCIDVRLFGGTFAKQDANLSLHGCVQITHAKNRFVEGEIYSETIGSPFRNSNEGNEDAMRTTLGTQFKLQEGHYVHHFSINPGNLKEYAELASSTGITIGDVDKLKEAMRKGVTFYDSAAKAGCENELLLWVELKRGSMLVLPSFVELITVNEDKEIDLEKIKVLLAKEEVKSQIDRIQVYYDKEVTKVINMPENVEELEII